MIRKNLLNLKKLIFIFFLSSLTLQIHLINLNESSAASKTRSRSSDEDNELLLAKTCKNTENPPIDPNQINPILRLQEDQQKLIGPPDAYKDRTSLNCVKNDQYKLNFGVVIYNDYYKFYRSTGLNEEGLREYGHHISSHGLELPKRIIYLHHNNYEEKMNTKAKLKAFGLRLQKKLYGGNFAYHEKNLSEKIKAEDCMSTDEKICTKGPYRGFFPFKFYHPHGEGEQHVEYLEAKCNPLSATKNPCNPCGSRPPTECHRLSELTPEAATDNLRKLMKQLLVSDDPTGFHCQGGLHRTGAAALLLRYLQGGYWTTDFKDKPTVNTTMKVSKDGKETKKAFKAELNNLAEKEYYDHNPKDFRSANIEMIKDFSQDPLFQCVKEKFAPYLNAQAATPPSSVKDCYPTTPSSGTPLLPPGEFKAENKAALFKACEAQVEKTSPRSGAALIPSTNTLPSTTPALPGSESDEDEDEPSESLPPG